MVSKLKIAIEKLMAEKFGYKPGNINLLMAGPIAQSIGNVDDPELTAQKIFDNLLKVDKKIPLEIRAQGIEATINYLSYFTYNDIKEVFLQAAELTKKEL